MVALNTLQVPLRYAPNTPQRRMHRLGGDARFLVADAGRRSGKTQGGAGEFSRRIVRDYRRKIKTAGPWKPAKGSDPKPFLRYAVVAPTYALLNEPKIALQSYLGHAEEGGLVVKQGQHVWWLKGGVRVDFLSGDRPERLVSHAYDGLWIEEAARTKAAVWTDNLRPTLSDTGGWAIFTSTPLGKNWFWEEVWARCNRQAAEELAGLRGCMAEDVLDPDYVGLHWTTAENDAIPGLAEEMARAETQIPRALFLRNYYASFDAFAGQLFDLSMARHFTRAEPSPLHGYRRLMAGGDLGTIHPSSFTLAAETNARIFEELGTVAAPDVIYDSDREWDARDRLHGQKLARACWTAQVYRLFREHVGEGWRRVRLYLPADRPDVKRQFVGRGFNVVPAYQEHEPAVSWFQGVFHADRFKFRSELLWRSVQNLRVPEAGRKSSKLWIDEHDDPWDGLRYAFSEPIKTGESPVRASFQALGWMHR